ncbi:hypothetical protein LINPERHAP2_LOCUS14333 [Linum perenne]
MGQLFSGTAGITPESVSKLTSTNLSSPSIGYDADVVGMVTRRKRAPPSSWPTLLCLNMWRNRLIIQFLRSSMLGQKSRRTSVHG